MKKWTVADIDCLLRFAQEDSLYKRALLQLREVRGQEMMTKAEEAAKKLGVRVGERFKVKGHKTNGSSDYGKFFIDKDGLKYVHPLGLVTAKSVSLESLLSGEDEIERQDEYPQDAEENEYRYLSPAWLNELAKGLTAGAVKHPGETWRTIPAREHVWRAVRHCVMWLMGDRSEPHLVNAGMRVMMAWETAQKEDG